MRSSEGSGAEETGVGGLGSGERLGFFEGAGDVEDEGCEGGVLV